MGYRELASKWEFSPEEKKIREQCENCKYSWRAMDTCAIVVCDYLAKTGKRRNCPVENCVKFAPIDKERRRRGWLYEDN